MHTIAKAWLVMAVFASIFTATMRADEVTEWNQTMLRAGLVAQTTPLQITRVAAIVQAAFTRRRKTVANALLAYRGDARLQPVDALAQAGLDGRRRPETLSIEEFARLSDVYVGSDGGQTPV